VPAQARVECDAAPTPSLAPPPARYNEPFVRGDLRLVRGYRRVQGVVTRADEKSAVAELLGDSAARMVDRNGRSGTRVLIDELLDGRRPPGYAYEPRSHYAVAAAVAQKR